MGNDESLNKIELERELNSFVERGVISQFIADKIKNKIEEREIKLSKEDLNRLVELINDKINFEDYKPERALTPVKESLHEDTEVVEKDLDVDEMIEAIKNLSERIKKIEEAQQMNQYKIQTGKIVTQDDKIILPEDLQEYKLKVSCLEEISKDPERIVIAMEWLQYLVDRVGKENLQDLLNYYIDIGWISDKAAADLLEYAQGIKESPGEKEIKKLSDLQAKDHIQSVLFIQKLKGEPIDNYFINRIERDLSRIKNI